MPYRGAGRRNKRRRPPPPTRNEHQTRTRRRRRQLQGIACCLNCRKVVPTNFEELCSSDKPPSQPFLNIVNGLFQLSLNVFNDLCGGPVPAFFECFCQPIPTRLSLLWTFPRNVSEDPLPRPWSVSAFIFWCFQWPVGRTHSSLHLNDSDNPSDDPSKPSLNVFDDPSYLSLNIFFRNPPLPRRWSVPAFFLFF